MPSTRIILAEKEDPSSMKAAFGWEDPSIREIPNKNGGGSFSG